MTRHIPDEARTVQINTRESLGLTDFLSIMWAARDIEHAKRFGPITKPQGKWPFIRASDRPPEALVDVTRLPVKLRGRE